MNYTDEQLKRALQKMLPEKCYMNKDGGALYHQPDSNGYPIQPSRIRDTELLHLCWLVEENLDSKHNLKYYNQIEIDPHAAWQQRVETLAKVKGIKI